MARRWWVGQGYKEGPKVKLHEAAEPVDQRQNLGICFAHELDCTADPPSQERRCFPEHLILCSSEQTGCPTQIFTLFTIFLSTWQPPPALGLCSGSPLLPFFFQLPSYSLIICAGWPDQSWHCHSPSQSLTQSFLLPAFCSLPPTGLKLLTKKQKNPKKILSLNLECGHWVCQLLSLRILLLIFFLLPH